MGTNQCATTKTFTLEGSLNEGNIAEIRNCFNDACPCYTDISINLKNNKGGNIVPVLGLIDDIRYSDINVTLNAEGYLFSAAAVLYFYLKLNIEDSDFDNVSIKPLATELLVVIHRPRRQENNYIQYATEIPNNLPSRIISLDLGGRTKLVDNLFEKLLSRYSVSIDTEIFNHPDFGTMTHVNKHIRDIYYANGDYVFTHEDQS